MSPRSADDVEISWFPSVDVIAEAVSFDGLIDAVKSRDNLTRSWDVTTRLSGDVTSRELSLFAEWRAASTLLGSFIVPATLLLGLAIRPPIVVSLDGEVALSTEFTVPVATFSVEII